MTKFKYTSNELNQNKVIKKNLDESEFLKNDINLIASRVASDKNILASIELLNQIGKGSEVKQLKIQITDKNKEYEFQHKPEFLSWEEISDEARKYYPNTIEIEDFMTKDEIDLTFAELKKINDEFSKKTSIINKTDLAFLSIATALQVAKSLIFPYVAEKFNYGREFDKSKRMDHNDPSTKNTHKDANDKFKDKHLENHQTGRWINILYQTPPYDITKGSKDLGINMGGAYHRMYTLGHDPILGWIFRTMNILTDIITLNNFQSYRVVRNPMRITNQRVSMGTMFKESYEIAKDDYLNLPSAIFAQAQHLKSDEFTKIGLPVPLISSINEQFASKLYKSSYDVNWFKSQGQFSNRFINFKRRS